MAEEIIKQATDAASGVLLDNQNLQLGDVKQADIDTEKRIISYFQEMATLVNLLESKRREDRDRREVRVDRLKFLLTQLYHEIVIPADVKKEEPKENPLATLNELKEG